MKLFIYTLFLGSLQTSFALKLARSVSEPRVVQFDTTRQYSKPLDALEKRDSTVGSTTYLDTQSKVRIVVNVTLGTPPQSFGLALDTGSADFVVRTTGSPMCAAGNCTAYGSFDPTKSSTYNDTKVVSRSTYGEGTTANGTLAKDTLSFAGITLSNFTFVAADQSTITDNVFGVGFPREEAIAASGAVAPYQNAAYAMKDAGLIKTAAYSVWLNDLNSPTGSILFGGVDTAKYTGTLQTVPIVPAYITSTTTIYGFAKVSLDAVGTAKGATTTLTTAAGFPISVLLDTGSTSSYLPQPIVDNLCSAFGCTVQGSNYFLPCSLQAPNTGNISFALSGVNLTVPLAQFVRPAGLSNGLCVFDIAPASSPDGYILGDSFLRGVYAVFDLEAATIALAPTVFNASTSNVLEITGSAADGIPGAQNASNVRAGIPSATGTIGPAATANGIGKAAAMALEPVALAAIGFLCGL